MKIVSIVGARPQFIKAAAVSRRLREKYIEILVHTGQHYDDNMSAIFFDQLGIPEPEVNLAIGSGLHGAQTGLMLNEIEKVLLSQQPNWVLVYGDTNSTLAGALAAAKLHIPVAHVEAGLRSFNKAMPEEINRVLTDHISNLLLCPSQTAVNHLADEGITTGVHLVGDVMFEALTFAVEKAKNKSNILNKLKIKEKEFFLATIHRAENTDNPTRLQDIFAAFDAIKEPIVLPLHPRTRKVLKTINYSPPSHVCLIEPLGYLDMVMLEKSAKMILTDSGGIQKEAYWLKVPCITLRDETEWVETVKEGWNILVGANTSLILDSVYGFSLPSTHPMLYGDTQTVKRCISFLE